MQSASLTVDDYLEEVDPSRKPALRQLRELCKATMPEHEEGMFYGMPGYAKNGRLEIGFNSQKNYISLYILKKDVLDQYRDRFGNSGKGCVRFAKPEHIDFELVRRILAESARSGDIPC